MLVGSMAERRPASAPRVATATTRAPSANRRVERVPARLRGRRARASTASGAPLVMSRLSAVAASTRTEPAGARGRRAASASRRSPLSADATRRRGAATAPDRARCRRPARPSVHGRFVAHQPEAQRLGSMADRRRRVPRLKRDATLGQGARLVGEQHLDVAEVLDAHQPLDQHLALRPAAGEPATRLT